MFDTVGGLFCKYLSIAGIMAITSLPTAAWELVPFETGTTEINQINALMAPILPLVGQNSGSQTLAVQSGDNNFSTAGIVGNGNVTLLQQAGSNNRAVQAIDGQDSAVMLVQGGSDNKVLQSSQGDRNFQYVGVSGSNNDIAYIQTGNDLTGALDLSDSTNTTVVAVQSGSNNALMPHISGSNDKLIIVGPGRLYVVDKNKL